MEEQKIEQWTCGDYSYESDLKITRSGPAIRLTELEQQLEVAETRCGSLKSQLDYMKMLYQGVKPSSTESIRTAKSKNSTKSSPRETEVNRLVEDKENCQENASPAMEDVKYYKFLKQIHKMQEITRELDTDLEDTTSRQSPRSQNLTPRLTRRHCVALEERDESISAECRRTKQIRRTHIVQGSAAEPLPETASILSSVTTAGSSLRVPEVSHQEHDIGDNETVFQGPTSHSASLRVDDLTPTINLMRNYICEEESECARSSRLSKQRRETIKQELVLKLSESMDSTPIAVKRKKFTRPEKKQRTGSCAGSVVKKVLNSKYEDSLSVTSNNKSNKRKKGKLRSANSRNTVMTKDTNLTDRKESKKRKQKGYSSATQMLRRFQPPVKQLAHTRAEVVEIYHNNAVEGGSGSVSISSSKHSKHRVADQAQNKNSPLKILQPVHQQGNPCFGQKVLKDENDARATTLDKNDNEGCQKHSSRSQKAQNCPLQDIDGEKSKCRSAPHPTRYFDPTITRNYELPTVASKLKTVNRSYFNRFNFRNIPFVVSTSVSPSHNLGLNIQQVLSIMKTRQPMAAGMAPLLIRKMSRSIKPASTFLGRINDQSFSPKSPKSTILSRQNDSVSLERPKTSMDCSASAHESVRSKHAGCLTAQTGKLQFITTKKTSSDDKDEDMTSETNWVRQEESGCVCCSKNSQTYNKMLKQYTSRKSITGNPALTASALLRERQEEINIGDSRYNREESLLSGNTNNKGIREVLINLHDQFEELNMAYEKLQEEAASTNDKSVTKRVAALEKELNAKEEEINAVVGLYKEVLQLKQQVNSTHGKNSFVCISTTNNISSPMMVPRSGNMRTQLVINPMQIFGARNNKGISGNTREPATATRLAGLLREIQSFQKQLLAL